MATGLLFQGDYLNPSASPSPMLGWNSTHFSGSVNPFAVFPCTLIFRANPLTDQFLAGNGFWTMYFHAQYTTTFPAAGNPIYHGCHPYPDQINATPNNTTKWEIALDQNDFVVNGVTVASTGYSRWYTQVVTVDSGGVVTFYYDWAVGSSMTATIGNTTAQTDGCLVIGDAPWNRGNEVYNGILRGFQFYSSLLTTTQIASEVMSPGSAVTPWYLNLNPTPDDVTDKSGNGHNPAWFDTVRPLLWSDDVASIGTRRAPRARGPFDRLGFLMQRKFDYTPAAVAAAATTLQRKTLSPLGTHTGGRQSHDS